MMKRCRRGACWMAALGPDTVTAEGIAVDAADNLVAIGRGVRAGAVAGADEDHFIVKFDASQQMLWSRQFGPRRRSERKARPSETAARDGRRRRS